MLCIVYWTDDMRDHSKPRQTPSNQNQRNKYKYKERIKYIEELLENIKTYTNSAVFTS